MTEIAAIPKARTRRLSRRRVVLIILSLIVAAAAGGAYAMRKTLNSPAVGQVVTTLPPVTRDSEVELAQFDGTNYSFVHPMTYIEQAPAQKPQPTEIESNTFISSGVVSRVLVTTVSKLPSGKLDDDASYYMRTQNSARYKMRATVVKNETVVIFTDTANEQYQQAAFWAHAGKLLTFTMTGVANDVPAMTAEFNDMVSSISWR